jgi:hypothetical protein
LLVLIKQIFIRLMLSSCTVNLALSFLNFASNRILIAFS